MPNIVNNIMPLKGSPARQLLKQHRTNGKRTNIYTSYDYGWWSEQAQFTVDPVAANAGVQRALAKFNANRTQLGSGRAGRIAQGPDSG